MRIKREDENRYRQKENIQREQSNREPDTEDITGFSRERKSEANFQNPVKENLGQTKRRSRRPLEVKIKGDAGESRNPLNTIADSKEIFINFIIDGTFSFSKVFPNVYYMIENIIHMIGDEKSEYRGITIKYGLTVLHDKAEPKKFMDGTYFTEFEKEFLQKVREIEFYGGSLNGREDLRGALDTGLRIVNNSGRESAYRGLFLFSDSLPEERDLEPDFLSDDQDEYINKGLRFAMFYTYTDDFTPKLKIVDRNGDMVENGKNEAFFYSLKELLSSDRNWIIERIQGIVKNILNQVSVNR